MMVKELTRAQMVELIAELVRTEGTQAAAAEKIGISAAYLGELLKGTRDPGPSVLAFFGIERVITYKKK